MGNNKIIGAKIKSIRESKQLSTQEVSERSGLSIEQIERIEGNIDFPSLAPLIKIARVLGVRLGTFLDDQSELGPVICRKKDSNDTNSIGFSNNDSKARKHMEYHSLSQDKSGRHMEPFLIDVAPSEDGVDFVLSTHEGEEFIYVLEGVLEIYLYPGGRRQHLLRFHRRPPCTCRRRQYGENPRSHLYPLLICCLYGNTITRQDTRPVDGALGRNDTR